LARIQDDTSSKQADTVSEGVDVTRLTEAVDLSVVCVGVRGQPATFDQLQQVGDVQQKKDRSIGPRTDPFLFVGKGSGHLHLIKFWPSRAPRKVCGGAKIFGSAL